MNIRLADMSAAADVALLVTLQSELQAIGRARYGREPLSLDKKRAMEERLSVLLRQPEFGVESWIAQEGQDVLGLAMSQRNVSTWDMAPVLNCHELYVRPSFRGRGVGSALIETMLNHARGLSCSKLTLETNVQNLGARRLYLRLGFEGTGLASDGADAITVAPTLSSGSPIVIQMTKRLN
jgi:ribosomal protein S18 acetylase RimI-like enzyme